MERINPCVELVLLTPKKGVLAHLCGEPSNNKITIRYRFSIPQLNNLLDQLSRVIIFTKFDLKSGYHFISVRFEDESKMTFKTLEGL